MAEVVIIEDGGPPRASARMSYVTLLNAAVGAGVLSIPSAFRGAGWAGGLLLLVSVALTEAFTLYVLSRYAESTGARTYSSLVQKMLGPGVSLAMSIVMLMYLWGSAVAYLIIIGDCFQPLAAQLLGPAWFSSRAAVISALGTGLLLPLCLPTSLSALASVSSITLYGLVIVVTAVGFRSLQIIAAAADPWKAVHAFSFSFQTFDAIPIIVFGFQCHTQVIAVFGELVDKPTLFGPSSSSTALDRLAESTGGGDLQQQQQEEATAAAPAAGQPLQRRAPRPKSAKLRGMRRVVLAAVATSGLGYAVTGLAGYLAFPDSVSSNVLNSFPPDDIVMQVARVAVGAIQVASYPVNHSPARAATADLLHALFGVRVGGGGWFNRVETLIFFGTTLALALVVRDLGSVFRLIGGTGGALLILAIPGALLCQYSWGKSAAGRQAGLAAPLLEGGRGEGARQPGHANAFHYLTSKLWWAGLVLMGLAVALCGLTLYSVSSELLQTA